MTLILYIAGFVACWLILAFIFLLFFRELMRRNNKRQ